jgi:hypothetical protein
MAVRGTMPERHDAMLTASAILRTVSMDVPPDDDFIRLHYHTNALLAGKNARGVPSPPRVPGRGVGRGVVSPEEVLSRLHLKKIDVADVKF